MCDWRARLRGGRAVRQARCTLHTAHTLHTLCVGVGAGSRAWQERSAALEGAFDSRRRRCGTALGRAVGCRLLVRTAIAGQDQQLGWGGEQRTAHGGLGFGQSNTPGSGGALEQLQLQAGGDSRAADGGRWAGRVRACAVVK